MVLLSWTHQSIIKETNGSLELGLFNSSHPEQNGRHFEDDVFKWIFGDWYFCIMIKISLKFVPKDPIGNKLALVQVMAWRRTGDKPLPELMLT